MDIITKCMSHDSDHNRRTVLKMAGGLATGLAFAAAGTAAANEGETATGEEVESTGCECWYESKCDGHCTDDLRYEQFWQRECCECDGETVCESWSRQDCCLTRT